MLNPKQQQIIRDRLSANNHSIDESRDANKFEIKIAVFNGDAADMVVDFGDPKGGNIVFGGSFLSKNFFTGEIEEIETVLKSTLYYSFKEDEETKEISIDLKQISNFNNFKVSEYTKDTLLLMPDATLRDMAKTYIKTTKVNNILILQKGLQKVILPAPDAIIGKVGEKDLSSLSVAQKEKYEKDNLKKYETPDTVLESVIRSLDYDTYATLLSTEIGNRLYAVASSTKRIKNIVQEEFNIKEDMTLSVLLRATAEYIGYKMLRSYGHSVKNTIMEDEERFKAVHAGITFKKIERFHEMVFETEENSLNDARLNAIFNFIDKISKNSKENKNPMATVISMKDAYRDAIGKKLKANILSIFDPQIGSAEGFMRAADTVGFGNTIRIWGTELRDDIKQDDARIKIIGGVNTSLMASPISNVFFAKNHAKAGGVLLTWNNPPYSLDDGIAKTSLDIYKNNTVIMGLYPTKMKNYLKNTLDKNSIIIDIPKNLTGYTDPATPERFLVVMGRKFTEEAEAREDEREISGVMSHRTGGLTEARLEVGATHDDLVRIIISHLAANNHIIGTKAMANLEYFEGKDWDTENILFKEIKKSAEETKAFYSNAEKFTKIIESRETMELFQKTIQPLQIAKTEKVFLDTRYYSETGSYEALRFDEVATNTSLLIHYTKAMPKIMDIIETIAEEKGMKLPIDRETINIEKFKVGERYTGEKVKVATDKLGMMKFAFYPTDFDIQDPVSRENILRVVKSVYADKGRELKDEEINALRTALERSNILTIKTAKSISVNNETEEYLVQSKEMLVIDNDEKPIPLNINNFDFYQKLEELEYFNIKDYIEIVELSTSTKRKIIEGFVDYVDNVTIKDIAKFNNEDKDKMINRAWKLMSDYMADGDNVSISVSKVNEDLNLREYIEGYFRKDPNLSVGKQISPLLEKHFPEFYSAKTKEGKARTISYIKVLENLYLANKVDFFGAPLSIVIGKLKDALVFKYKTEEKSEKEIMELDNRFVDFEEDVRLSLTDLEKFVQETSLMAERLGTTLYTSYQTLKNRVEKIKELEEKGELGEETISKLFDDSYNVFDKWTRRVASLMEHQIKEPENFTEMEDKKTNFMLKKMRTGKTLTFVYSGILEMFTKKADMEMLLNSNNIKDIASQLTQHFPILLPSIEVFASDQKHNFKKELTHKSLYHTSAIFNPLQIRGLNKQVIGGGKTMDILGNTFSKEIEMIEKALDQKYPDGATFDDMIKDYKDSPFIKMIEQAKEMCKG